MIEVILINLFLVIFGAFFNFYIISMCLIILVFILKFLSEEDFSFLGIFLSLDIIGWLMCLLSMWLVLLMRISIKTYLLWDNYKYNFFEVIILYFLLISFRWYNIIGFYIFFESVLVFILLIIFFWGGTPEKTQAGIYILIYTLFGSLPFLVILLINNFYGSLHFIYLDWDYIRIRGFIGIFILIAFLVKFPIFLVHIWLPKAHVEAPVGGSIILAGVLLKLGGYGFFRLINILKEWISLYGIFLLEFRIFGGIIVAFFLFMSDWY